MSAAENSTNFVIATHGDCALSLAELLTELKYQTSWHFVRSAVQRKIVRGLVQEHEIDVSEEQVFAYMDNFREERDLYSEEEIAAWLDSNNLSDDEFYDLCQYETSVQALKQALFPDEKIVELFAFQKLELDAVELYHIIVPTEDLAEEIIAQAQEGENFFDMARKYSTDEGTRKSCGYMGVVRRADLRAEIEAVVFAARVGEIVGPFKGARGYHLYLITEILPAVLDLERGKQIRDDLFNGLMHQKMASHVIQCRELSHGE